MRSSQCYLPIPTTGQERHLKAERAEMWRAEREVERRTSLVLVQSAVSELHRFVDAGTIDVILTDPPYPHSYLHTWRDLAEFAVHALRPGGHLLAMSGKAWMWDVMDAMRVDGLEYRWTISLRLQRRTEVMWRNIHSSHWKPIFWYVRDGANENRVTLPDEITGSGMDKDFHEWGQSVGEFHDILQRVSGTGDIICDPFVGGGTSAVAAVRRGCSFIGADIDEHWIYETKKRIGQEFVSQHGLGDYNV